jgi:uncharacterized protein (TIGR03083 family)
MRAHEMLVRERLALADLMAGLTPQQLAVRSYCTAWTVHEVAAHLTTYLRWTQPKIYAGIVTRAGNLDRWNLWLTGRQAHRDIDDLVAEIRRDAGSRTTIPFSGYDPLLADCVLHDLDVRRPLGLHRDVPEAALKVAFDHIAERPVPGYSVGRRLRSLRLVATDTGWAYGTGPVVRGPAEDLVLAMAGRAPGLDRLDGEGLPVLRQRLSVTGPAPVAERMMRVVRVLTHPAPRSRRSRQAVVGD